MTTTTTSDDQTAFAEYAHPEVLVSTDWVAGHLDDPNVRILESDEDILLYELGHIPGALKLDWQTQMQQPVNRDFVDKAGFEQLMRERGVSNDTTVVLYGDKGITPDKSIIAYCRIGERSSHTWFVLKYLLGYPDVRNYDGSWTEWGSLVGVPNAVGDQPG